MFFVPLEKVFGVIFNFFYNILTSICINTLYSYIYKGVFFNLSKDNLIFKKKEKPKKTTCVISRPPKGTSIEQRPEIVKLRSEFGHWEMDCVCGTKKSKSALLVLTERVSRKELIFKLTRQTSDNVVNCLNRIERKLGKKFRNIFKSITVDNGAEFAYCNQMEKSVFSNKKRTTIFYCHPYCSSERGSNERMNREIRRKYPKGTNFDSVSDEEIRQLESWLNSYPRGVLKFASPNEIFYSFVNN